MAARLTIALLVGLLATAANAMSAGQHIMNDEPVSVFGVVTAVDGVRLRIVALDYLGQPGNLPEGTEFSAVLSDETVVVWGGSADPEVGARATVMGRWRMSEPMEMQVEELELHGGSLIRMYARQRM